MPAVPRSTPEFLIPEAERRRSAEEEGEITVDLTEVVVEGSTVYSEAELVSLYEEQLGQEISLASVFDIAEAITAKYRNDGYVLSRALLPPQTITEGVVRIRVVEGYINAVRIEGEVHGGRRLLLDAYANKIKSARPLTIDVLERYLLLFNDLPGVTSQAVIGAAKETPGASELIIDIKDTLADGFMRVDNRGSKFNGPYQAWLGAGVNSLSGYYDRITGRVVVAQQPDELRYYEVGHERQIGTDGEKLYLQVTRTESEPGYTLKKLHIESKSHAFRVGGTTPVIRSRAKNVSLYAEFVARNSETTIFGARLSRDHLRFIRVGVLYDSVDRFGGVNRLGLDLNQGMSILGASSNGSTELSRQKGRTNFTKFQLTLSRLQRISSHWSLFANFTSQYALSKLLASEEFGIGGERCGRAYDPSEVTGDQGGCLLGELRYGHNLGASALVEGYQLYGFSDIGGVWRKDPGALVLDENTQLASAGGGVRLNFTDHLSGSFEIAWPLIKKTDSRTIDVDSRRVFFTFTARF